MKIIVTAYRGFDRHNDQEDPMFLVVLEPAAGEVADTKAYRDCAAVKANAFAEVMFTSPHQILYDVATGNLPSGAMRPEAEEFLAQHDTVQVWQIEHTGDLAPTSQVIH